MTDQTVLDLAQNSIMVTLYLVGPALMTAVVVGVIVSIFQAVTSIQDMTLTFVPKVVAVGVVMLLTAGWAMEKLLAYTVNIFVGLDHMV